MSDTFFYYKISYFDDDEGVMKEDEGITFTESGKYSDAVVKIADYYGEENLETVYIQYIDVDIPCLTLDSLREFLGKLNLQKEGI